MDVLGETILTVGIFKTNLTFKNPICVIPGDLMIERDLVSWHSRIIGKFCWLVVCQNSLLKQDQEKKYLGFVKTEAKLQMLFKN
jgi:hypothetical protein